MRIKKLHTEKMKSPKLLVDYTIERQSMDFWTGLQLYVVVAVALAGTSYWNLYRPAVKLLKEILDQEVPRYDSWLGGTIWIIITFTLAPVTLFVLLSGNNDKFITDLAISLANGIIEEEE